MKKINLLLLSLLLLGTTMAQNMADRCTLETSVKDESARVVGDKAMWDVVWSFGANAAGQPGIETNGMHIFTATWNAETFTRYDMDGGNATDFTVDGATNLRDMAYDGTYFYGAAADMNLRVMDLENETLIETITATCGGVTGIRHIAYDPELDGGNGGFWIGNWSELGAIDMEGNELMADIGGNESCYGSAYDNSDPENPVLWLFQQVGAEVVTFQQFDINTATYTDVTHEAIDVPGYEPGDASLAGGACTWDDPVSGLKLLIGTIQQDPNLIFAYELSSSAPSDCYNFDDLIAGEFLASQLGGMWTTWGDTPGGADDGFVSDDQSHSPDNSFVVFETPIDLVYKLDEEPIETGAWLYSHYIYVPSGTSGYFNVQSSPIPGEEWVIELYFNDDGTGYFEGGSDETFEYTPDSWIFVEINFDLDTDLAQVFLDGDLMTEFSNEFTIGGINYYGSDTGGTPGAYYDDVCFDEGMPISEAGCYNFDDLIAGEFLAAQLGGMWTTWGDTPGGADDGFVSNDQSHSPDNSFVVFESSIDLVFKLAEEPIETGAWLYSHYIYVPSGSCGYFNVQSNPIPGEEWVLELFFNADGTGYFENGSSDTFEYTLDSWVLVEINFDLDTDLAQVYFDGNLMTTFSNEFSIGGINYYGNDDNGDPEAYYDDVCFKEGTPLTVGIDNIEENQNIAVYPNPANDFVYVHSSENIELIEVFNVSGQLVVSQYANTKQVQVNTSKLESGIYFIKIHSSSDMISKKLLIN